MNIVFWDVDTQNDFMDKNGTLYVPESEKIKPNLRELTQYAIKNNIQILGSVDTHLWQEVLNEDGSRNFEKEMELNKRSNPQYETEVNEFASEDGPRLPIHCIKGSWGHQKIEETLVEASYIEATKDKNIEALLKNDKPRFLEKHSFNPSQNQNWKNYIHAKKIDAAIIYGVVSGICVRAAVKDLAEEGVNIYVVEDAIMDLGEEDKILAYKTFEEYGTKLITTKDVIENTFDKETKSERRNKK